MTPKATLWSSLLLLCMMSCRSDQTPPPISINDAIEILNGRGPAVMQYIDKTIPARQVLQHFPLCETTCASTEFPCAKVSASPFDPTCKPASVFFDTVSNPDEATMHKYCPDGYVCCGADCRPTSVRKCTYRWQQMNAQYEKLKQSFEDFNERTISHEDDRANLTTKIKHISKKTEITTLNWCLQKCNGWDMIEQHNITRQSCSSLCSCDHHAQPKIISDDVFVCTRKLGPGQTLFSSGMTLGNDPHGLTCPPSYECQVPSKCAPRTIEPEIKTHTTANDDDTIHGSSSEKLSVGAVVGIVVGVIAVLGIITMLVILYQRRKDRAQYDGDDCGDYKAL